MKILGAGLSKTGTTSLHRALGTLGFKSLHYDQQRLNDIIDGTTRNPDFRRYDDVDAVLDIPAACFFEELLQAYPESKCILTIRDEDDWWTSIQSHFGKQGPLTSPEQDPFKWRLRHYVYGSATAHEFLFRKRYRDHNRQVLQNVAPHRLLVIDVAAGAGWPELCQFLHVPVPDLRFPHQNRREEGSAQTQQRIWDAIARCVPPHAQVALVDENALNHEGIPDERQISPFPECNGQFWGVPEDDAMAIRELERLRNAGIRYLVIAWPAFWWLDYFGEFHQYLLDRFTCVADDALMVAFDMATHDPSSRGRDGV